MAWWNALSADCATASAVTGVRPPSARRRVELDVLRAVAIMLVLGRYSVAPVAWAGHLSILAKAWLNFGWTGVDLFFVLSGYLIGGLLFAELKREGSIEAARFIGRRAWRIWPPYFVYIASVFAAFLWWYHWPCVQVWRFLAPCIIHVQNYFPYGFHDAVHHLPPQQQTTALVLRNITWSLAIEEHFYLALPLVLMCASRRCTRAENGTRES